MRARPCAAVKLYGYDAQVFPRIHQKVIYSNRITSNK